MPGLTVDVVKTCVFCGKVHTLIVDRLRYEQWQTGSLIQVAFPDMSVDQREILISGTCPECWEKNMGGGPT